jgi:CheY-like chemotaxis protein
MRKVLIVEDDPINMKLVVEILNSLDFLVVQTATNGHEAIKMTENDLYDLILMDIGLPGIDGIETARRIKDKPGYHKTPIIALTAFAMKGDRERFLEGGFDHYLSKPINVNAFINLIKVVLKKE